MTTFSGGEAIAGIVEIDYINHNGVSFSSPAVNYTVPAGQYMLWSLIGTSQTAGATGFTYATYFDVLGTDRPMFRIRNIDDTTLYNAKTGNEQTHLEGILAPSGTNIRVASDISVFSMGKFSGRLFNNP